MIGRFLLEIWQLLYWSLLAPAKLQQRMNEWVPNKDKDGQVRDTSSFDVFSFLAFDFSPGQVRFICQFLILIIFLSSPLVLLVIQSSEWRDWLLILLILPAAYSLAVWNLSLSLLIPIACWLIYFKQPEVWSHGVHTALNLLPSLKQLSEGIGAYICCLAITTIVCSVLHKWNQKFLARSVCLIGGSLSVVVGSWLSTDLGFTAVFSILILFWLILFVFEKNEEVSDHQFYGVFIATTTANNLVALTQLDVAFNFSGTGIFPLIAVLPMMPPSWGVLVSVMNMILSSKADTAVQILRTVVFAFIAILLSISIGLFGLIPGFISIGFMWVWAGITWIWKINPLILLLVGWTSSARWYGKVASTSSSSQEDIKTRQNTINAGGLGMAAGAMTLAYGLLTDSRLNPQEWLAIPAAVILSYYRILPDYIIFITTILLNRRISYKEDGFLKLLDAFPPNKSPCLWLPIPQHDYILVEAFRENSINALPIFQEMQASLYPGFKRTINQAFPQIVANQLIEVKTTDALIQTASLEHTILPLLLPNFYRDIIGTEEQPVSATPTPTINAEISIMLPKLQIVAQDVSKALGASSIAIRERGLERLLDSLKLLKVQLAGLGLVGAAIPRWQAVIQHWQQIIQQELEVQQNQSRGELLNPFQYGNPLRRDRQELFKGRQSFADEIVRLVLDRNRPTLVLHGPRRCGKSSFLYNLPRLLPSNILPVYVDMQSAAIRTDEAAFCQGIARAIHRDVQGIDLPIVPSRNEFLSSPYIVLEDWLAQTTSKLEDKRLLLNLDEFEKIGEAIHERRFSLQVFDELRSLIQHWEQLGFLFSGVQTLDELGPNWSSYFISVVPIEMLYLEPEEAEELLCEPDPKFALQYDVGIVETIIELTRCQPYLLQLLGSALVTQANRQSTQLITSELLQVSIQDAFTNGAPYFTNVWTEFTGSNPAEIIVGQQLLLEIAQESYSAPDTSDPVVQAALKRLRRYHVIEQVNENDQIEIPLLKQWICERAIKA